MKRLKYIKYILLALAVAGCSKSGADKPTPNPTDTVYTVEAAMAIYDQEPEQALQIIDSAELVGNIKHDLAQFLRATVFCKSTVEQNPDSAQQILLELWDSKYVENLSNREMVLDLLMSLARMRGDNEQWLHWATEKADCCRQEGDETETLRTEAEIGAVLTQLGEVERGLSKLNGAIASLDNQRHFNEMDACIVSLKRKIAVYIQLERQEENIPLAHRIIEKINDYRGHRKEYADGSYRMPPNDEEFEKYCTFYTAQAHCFLAQAYATMDKMDSARYYLALYERSDFGKSFIGQRMMGPTLCLVGEYGKMLAIYDKIEARVGNDTVSEDYLVILYGRAMAAQAAGNYRSAASYWQRHSALYHLWHMQQQDGMAYHYAARYHLQEEKMEGERLKAKGEKSRNMAIVVSSFALLVALFCVWLLFQRRAMKRKNKVLVEQIAEAAKWKAESEKWKMDTELEVKKHLSPDKMTDEELFEYLNERIRAERLFLNPDMSRQTLMDKYHITDRRIGAAFSKGSPNSSLPDFICELRIEYACHLLTNRPDLNIGEVAAASGFSNANTFSRYFRRKLDVTPSYYRSQTIEKKGQEE